MFEIEFNLLSDKFVVDGLTFKPATVKSVSAWEHHSSWNDQAHKICFCASYFNYDVSQAPSSVQPFSSNFGLSNKNEPVSDLGR